MPEDPAPFSGEKGAGEGEAPEVVEEEEEEEIKIVTEQDVFAESDRDYVEIVQEDGTILRRYKLRLAIDFAKKTIITNGVAQDVEEAPAEIIEDEEDEDEYEEDEDYDTYTSIKSLD